jgi:hypothetical protein
MVSLSRIRAVSRSGEDWEWAENLKADLLQKRKTRKPFYLTARELGSIVSYKLREQEGRTATHRKSLGDALVGIVSEAAFKIQIPANLDLELTLRVGLLTALPGIGIGVASAVLALSEPEQYAIIDWRGWRQAFGTGRESFGCKHYCEYMRVVRSAAKQLGWQPQVVDWCLWNLDRAA